jgi:hypothetical protein
MRALFKLIAVSAVVGLFALERRFPEYPTELAIAGASALALVAAAIFALDRKRQSTQPTQIINTPPARFATAHAAIGDDDVEGKTVRAPMSAREAMSMHARHAPVFDRELQMRKHEDQHAAWFEDDPQTAAGFDQERYEQAQQYALAFDAQLSSYRRTRTYDVPTPRYEIARGSYTDGHYRAVLQRRTQPGPAVEPALVQRDVSLSRRR